MLAQWYPGVRQLRILAISHTRIHRIAANAFNSTAFHRLQELRIVENALHIVQYRASMLIGLHMLNCLEIREQQNLHGFPPNWLAPLQIELKRFEYEQMHFKHLALTNLFGHERLRLKIIHVACVNATDNTTNFLSARNFTALALIEDLTLRHCSIDYIERGTFDAMATTLNWLTLHGIRVKRIDVEVFRRFLDASSPGDYKILTLTPIECAEAFYQLRNLTLISFGHCGNRSRLTCVGQSSGENPTTSPLQQVIHSAKWLLKPDYFRFPKFTLKYNAANATLTVQQPSNEPYRLMIWCNGGKRKPDCLCHRRRNRTESFSITFFDHAEFISACVILVPSTFRRSIPLHCITIRQPPVDVPWHAYQWWIIFGGMYIVITTGACTFIAIVSRRAKPTVQPAVRMEIVIKGYDG